jgi:hypothetical protein
MKLSSILLNIKSTYEYNKESVDFLDGVNYKCMEDAACDPDGQVKVCMHQKELIKYLYTPWQSYHPQSMYKSFIYGYVRGVSLCTEIKALPSVLFMPPDGNICLALIAAKRLQTAVSLFW